MTGIGKKPEFVDVPPIQGDTEEVPETTPVLPSGTVTMLFSDIAGSTSMVQRAGARWAEVLSVHRAILRDVWLQYGGTEMSTEGDSFFVVFGSAHEGLAAAIEAQRRLARHSWPDRLSLRVRIGLHTGEPQRHEDNYIGIDVHRAARIAATAAGGQIVLSAATHALVGHDRSDISLRDLGLHRLKDLAEPEELFDVDDQEHPEVFPPLRSLGTLANLPSYSTPLVGREEEGSRVVAAFEEGARLVTLTGPGGTGKTRLAVSLAAELQARSPSELFFVDLQTADRAAVMWAHIAEAVGAPGDADLPPSDRALTALTTRRALLVLDNLEQVEGADAVVSELLQRSPNIRLMVTSRRPLHLVDERIQPVPPLPLPDDEVVDPAIAGVSAAVQLFVRRVGMVRPGFVLAEDNVREVLELCRRLDGLPLALELAAARMRLLSLRALLRRIGEHLESDPVTATDRAKRQRTLAATVAWSYDLLDERQQQVFRRLGVFATRADLDAVEKVVAAEGVDTLGVIAQLADASLVEIADSPDGEPMVSMLETIRGFARDRLESSSEVDDVRLRHAQWCVDGAREVAGLLQTPQQMHALDRMDVLERDVRSALDWCLVLAGEGSAARRACGYALVEAMHHYWYRFGYAIEGRGWEERALLALQSEGDEESTTLLDTLHALGVSLLQQSELQAATDILRRALALARRLGDLEREARACNSLGIALRDAGEIEGARSLIEESVVLARRAHSRGREATALSNMVLVHLDLGKHAEALAAAREALAADREQGDLWGIGVGEGNLAGVLLVAEGPQAALEHLVRVAPRIVALSDHELSIDVVESFAAIWAALGDARRAAVLLGAADQLRATTGLARAVPDEEFLQRFVSAPLASLPDEERDHLYARGHALGIDDAVALGREHPEASTAAGSTASPGVDESRPTERLEIPSMRDPAAGAATTQDERARQGSQRDSASAPGGATFPIGPGESAGRTGLD